MPVACRLGLVGVMKVAIDKVLYTVAETAMGKIPLRLYPIFELK